jgi:hypothetical protein
MRGWGTVLAVAFAGLAAPAGAQTGSAEVPRTAEQFIETARDAYSVDESRRESCPAPVGNEIVVCRRLEDPEQFRAASPTERANAAGRMPPDPIPSAPYVLGLPECGVEVTCHRIGRTPPPIYIIDLAAIPEALTPEEAALVFRAEDRLSPEAASPTAAP